MSLEYSHKLIPRARELRKEATPQERHLWYDFLAKYPVRFQRQKVILNYIADFYCHKARLVIELDGSQHYDAQGQAYDAERTAHLERLGLKVIRYSNREIDRQFQEVCSEIDRVVKESCGGDTP